MSTEGEIVVQFYPVELAELAEPVGRCRPGSGWPRPTHGHRGPTIRDLIRFDGIDVRDEFLRATPSKHLGLR